MLSKVVKKQVVILTLFFVVNMLLPSLLFAEGKNSDIESHWAGKKLNEWSEIGLIRGYMDNTFKPDKPITRAEFTSLINRALGLKQKEEVNFIDIIGNEWFAEEFFKAISVNYISGYEDGSIRPNSPISREEVAAVISRLLLLDTNNFGDKNPIRFRDKEDISDWSKDVINSVVKTGVMAGYSDYTFKPKQYITRAEAVITLDRALGKIFNTNNINGQEKGIDIIKGNATISSVGSLRNTVIMGNLYLTEGIEEGEVSLDNVTVNGKTIIRGGGSNSIYLNNSKIKSAIVNKADGNIRIVASGTTSIEKVELSSGGKLEEQDLEGAGFNRVIVNSLVPTNAKIQFAGSFNDVEIAASEVNLEIISGRINSLQITDSAVNTSVQVQKAAVINTLELNSAVKVTGDGRVSRAIINAPGTSFEKSPLRIIIEDNSIIAEIGNQKIRKQDTIDNDSNDNSRNEDNSGGDSPAQDNSDEKDNSNSDDGDTEIDSPEQDGNTEDNNDNEIIKDKESMDEHIHEINADQENCENHGEGDEQINGDIEEIDEQIDGDTENEEVETEVDQEAEVKRWRGNAN